jgi:opacity protein-like surface antigen
MIRILFSVLLAIMCSSHVLAQYSNPRASVFAAGSFLTGARTNDLGAAGIRETDHTKGPRIGFRFGVDFTPRWGGEATYSYSRHDFRVTDPGAGGSGQEREFPVNLHHFLINGSYYVTPSNMDLRPFLSVGLGLAHFAPTESAREEAQQTFLDGSTRIGSSTKFAFNFGGGLERRVSDALGVRVDFRDHITALPKFGLPEAPLNPGGVFYPATGLLHDIEIAIGVLYHFGN